MARKPAEQRISPRIPIDAPAVVSWRDEKLVGYIELVNLNGMYVASERFPEVGEYIDLILSLPGDPRSFRVRASVIHTDQVGDSRRPGFGARFERPPLAFLDAIRNLGKGH
jgi:Tfp pilus assembly protein PilZ